MQGEAAAVTERFVGAFMDELGRAGVEHVCVCPGSRSTPLTVAAQRTPGLRVFSHLDERSASFFALGAARTTHRPVALVCTSGTAAANFLPAVIEAHYARVPLLVLTADRPPELRDFGAGQTVDQIHLYGRAVRRFVEVGTPGDSAMLLRHARVLAARAVGDAMGRPPGPVHLNFPFREPLEPARVGVRAPAETGDVLADQGRGERAFAPQHVGAAVPDAGLLSELSELACVHPRGLIACGAMPADPDFASAVMALSAAAGWPILADPLSNLRSGRHLESPGRVVATADSCLRSEAFAAGHRPDLVLRIGGPPVSKVQRLWLEAAPPAELWLVDDGVGWDDPSHLVSRMLRVSPVALCAGLAEALEARPSRGSDAWMEGWARADRAAAAALHDAMQAEARLFEPRATATLAGLLGADGLLHVSNSMPIRDLDSVLGVRSEGPVVHCNRGANGIDGVLSTALGAAAVHGGRTALLIGDLALLHDIGGLFAVARHGLDVVIVVLHNDGGGIFSFLPIAEHGESVSYDDLYRVSHGLDFERVAALYGLGFLRVDSWKAYAAGLGRALDRGGAWLIEVPVDADENLVHYRALLRGAAAAAEREGGPGG